MLSEVLSKETCAKCRFCCSFRRKSLWETPLLSEEFVKTHPVGFKGAPVKYMFMTGDGFPYAQTDLSGLYKSDDPEEEVPCPFLDPDRGCILPENEKPFDCKIWPLRIMRMPEGELKVCLTPTCPAINRLDIDVMKKLVQSGLGDRIREEAGKYPYMIKDYREGFVILE